MNEFTQKLEYSRGESEKIDIELLQRCIIGCETVRKTSVEEDKKGVDYVATLRGGANVRIDAKTREPGCSKYWKHNQPELALEIYSVVPDSTHKGSTGWTLSEVKEVDIILYTFDKSDTQKFYMIPYQHLRMAFRKNYKQWSHKYSRVYQINRGYRSEAMFVPAPVVLDAITDISIGQATGA